MAQSKLRRRPPYLIKSTQVPAQSVPELFSSCLSCDRKLSDKGQVNFRNFRYHSKASVHSNIIENIRKNRSDYW